jgi:hypothetical protein
VEQFVAAHGKGVMKRQILDRGFLDSLAIERCKQEWGIDVLISAKNNILDLHDFNSNLSL